MSTTYALSFHIDYRDGTTKKITSNVTQNKFNGTAAKVWKRRICNKQSDLVVPYAYFFFSKPQPKQGGYSWTSSSPPESDTPEVGGNIFLNNLITARDCRLTGIATDERTIFGTWEI